jgi:hypothetical protein
MYSIVGSVALVNAARCVYLVLPFTHELKDDRVLISCAKMNDNPDDLPEDRVWLRRFGQLFEPTEDDPEDYWNKDKKPDGPWLTLEMLENVLRQGTMNQSRLADRLAEEYNDGVGKSSVHKWLARSPFKERIQKVGGFLTWKELPGDET